MNYVVDIEGFYVKNRFIVKELAYYRIEDSKSEQFIFCAPYKWSELTKQEKKTVAFCEKHLHRIKWSIGLIPYNHIRKILSESFSVCDTIYVKGIEKLRHMTHLLQANYKIKNLEIFNCPKITHSFLGENSNCILKQHIKNHHCAVLKVYRFASFLKFNVL